MAGYGGPTYTTETQQSQYQVPGLGGAYSGILSGLQGQYNTLSSNLASGYGGLQSQANADVSKFGQVENAQIQAAYQQNLAQQNQGLINRGLGNTTVMNSIGSGLLQGEQLALTNVAERKAMLGMQALATFGLPALASQQNVGLASLQAQQQLGMQYLNLLGQQGVRTTRTQSQTWSPFASLGGGGGGAMTFHNPGNYFGSGASSGPAPGGNLGYQMGQFQPGGNHPFGLQQYGLGGNYGYDATGGGAVAGNYDNPMNYAGSGVGGE